MPGAKSNTRVDPQHSLNKSLGRNCQMAGTAIQIIPPHPRSQNPARNANRGACFRIQFHSVSLSVIPTASAPHRCDGWHIVFRLSCSIMTLCYVCAILSALLKPPSRPLTKPHRVLTRKLTVIISRVFHNFRTMYIILNNLAKNMVLRRFFALSPFPPHSASLWFPSPPDQR